VIAYPEVQQPGLVLDRELSEPPYDLDLFTIWLVIMASFLRQISTSMQRLTTT
jgi:hypothetical protein